MSGGTAQETSGTETEKKKKLLKNFLSWGPMVISIIAVGISATAPYFAYARDIQSEKPKMEFEYFSSLEEIRPGFYMVNNGMGPAILKKLSVYVDAKKFNTIEDAITELLEKGDAPWGFYAEWAEFGGDHNLPPGHRVPLLTVFWEAFHIYPGFEEIFDTRLCVKIRYCSLDNECWNVMTHHGRC